jgi:DNA-binding HxlR family transcriptional regulator
MLGDPWTLLVVRDLMFKGRETFGDFLSAGEGAATNILADRLLRLEADGIVERRRDPADERRRIYRLTAKGIDLAPLLVEMVLWSSRHEKTDAPPEVVRAMRKDKGAFLDGVRAIWEAARFVTGDRRKLRTPASAELARRTTHRPRRARAGEMPPPAGRSARAARSRTRRSSSS